MTLVSVVRLFLTLVSLAILIAAGYLLWTWYQGDYVRDADGSLHFVRDRWRLWTGVPLLGWSALGRQIVLRLLARSDDDPTRAERALGQMLKGADGSDLYVEFYGPAVAPPIVLTHGWSLDSTIWFYAKRDLAKRFRVIVWDLPGLGKSKAGGSEAVSLASFAQDLRAVLGLANGPAVLVGHSIGGMTIETLARDSPELFGREVAGIVLLNTTYTNPLETIVFSGLFKALRWPIIEPLLTLQIWLQPLAWMSSWQSYFSGSAHLSARLAFGRYVTRSQLEHVALLMTRNPPAVMAKGDLAMFRWDATAALRRIAVPALVIGGSADIVTRPEASRTIATKIPGARLQIVEGVNHMGFLERADLYNSAIAEFATSVQAGLIHR